MDLMPFLIRKQIRRRYMKIQPYFLLMGSLQVIMPLFLPMVLQEQERHIRIFLIVILKNEWFSREQWYNS